MALIGEIVAGETPLSDEDLQGLKLPFVLERHFDRPPFTWGGNAELGSGDAHRPAYLLALKAADQGNYALLLQLCRAS